MSQIPDAQSVQDSAFAPPKPFNFVSAGRVVLLLVNVLIVVYLPQRRAAFMSSRESAAEPE